MYEIKPEQEVNDSSPALLDSDSNLSSGKAGLQFANPFVQRLGRLLEQAAFHVRRVGSLQREGVFFTPPIQSDPYRVIRFRGVFGRFHKCSLLFWMRTRWLWSSATLIVESSVGTTSEYALSDQSASPRSKVFRKPSSGWG